MSSTPPVTKKTHFEEAFYSHRWKKYHWTMLDNTFLPDARGEMDAIIANRGIDPATNIKFRREFLGEMIYDEDLIVYSGYKTTANPLLNPTGVIGGIDYGMRDYFSIVLLAYNKSQATGEVIYEFKKKGLLFSEIVQAVTDAYHFGKNYCIKHNLSLNFKFYADSANPMETQTLYSEYKLPVWPCYKYAKVSAIQQLADFMKRGIITIPQDGALADECDQIIWKSDDQGNKVLELDDDYYHEDIVASLRYAFRQWCYECNLTVAETDSQPVIPKKKPAQDKFKEDVSQHTKIELSTIPKIKMEKNRHK
ncbi:hypothetical protein FACS1894172_09290 [Spirochaetia bacterium]|nr:hypothetical protein FACS1894164_11630 [Spirochaetia bacterium]GHU32523.1 hypothetical protein FACS1894172_09290 [Spirochaetia bacterium]